MTMTTGSDPEKLRESLWEASVYPYCGKRPETREEHEAAALHVIQMSRTIAQSTDDPRTRAIAMIRAFEIWGLLVAELGPWLIDGGTGVAERTKESGPRSRLKGLLRLQDEGSPIHKPWLDPVGLLIPRDLRNLLIEALDALDNGEVQPLVQPAENSRHGDAWTVDQMRARALEHIHFLCGQGVSKGIARRRVAVHMGKGSIEVLRSWERKNNPLWTTIYNLEGRLKAAQLAGQVAINGPQDEDNAYALVTLAELQKESLEEFGSRFQKLFGDRSWSRGSD